MRGRSRSWTGFPRYGGIPWRALCWWPTRERRSDGLHQAAFEGNAKLVEELLARGADLSLRDAVHDGTLG